ncbi:DMT family transporter [Symbioplanes lichenis]|uniref:DMT family transporter n=1 Tax=Symbioplanes lichenis TaxID=1629072 RepID=UPI002738B84D|nr:DMT family transporter [Actinoplanes lichenis]
MRARLAAESAAQVLLLTATWLVVDSALRGASSGIVSAGRTAFTVIGLLVLTRFSRSPAAGGYRWGQVVLLAGTGVTAYTMLSTVAIAQAGPALPSLVLALAPAVVLAAESVLGRTWPPLATIAGTAVAIIGAILYVLPRLAGSLGGGVVLGTVCAVAAMLSMACYGLAFARVNRGYSGPTAPRILPVFAWGTVPLALWAGGDVTTGERAGWAAIGLLAFLGIVIYVPAYLVQHRIILAAGAAYSALLGLAVPPLVGVSSAALGLGPWPTSPQVVGMILTLGGMAPVILRRSRGVRMRD